MTARDPMSYNWPVEDGELDDSYGTCAECGGKLDVRAVSLGDDVELIGDPPMETFCTGCGHVPGNDRL